MPRKELIWSSSLHERHEERVDHENGGGLEVRLTGAESDLNNLIWQAADNAPLFIEAFYEGCEALRGDDFTLPEAGRINRILADHQAGFEIRLPAIVAVGIHKPIPVPERYQSLDEQVLTWLTTLHGYLSSPTGGGVRHGVDLKSGITINADEGRLYCNLIRSYVTFLMAEHERLSRTVPG